MDRRCPRGSWASPDRQCSSCSRSRHAGAPISPASPVGAGTAPAGPRLPLEHHDGAGDLAGLHGPEELVDVLELAAAGDHLVELEASLPIQLDVTRHVHLEAVGSHAAALDPLLAEEHGAVELDLLPHGDHADDRRGATRADAIEALLGGDLEPDGLERVVDTAVGEIANGLHGVVALGVDAMSGAELLGRGELGIDGVHRDDHARPRDARALDAGEAPPPPPPHRPPTEEHTPQTPP